VATECAQYPTVFRVFLREEFARLPGIFAKLFLSFEDSDLFSVPFDEVDKIDMLGEDDLYTEEEKAQLSGKR
jgi:hypothetical protein